MDDRHNYNGLATLHRCNSGNHVGGMGISGEGDIRVNELTEAELKQAYASVIIEGTESELSKLWLKHFPGWSMKVPLGLTEEMKRDFRQWAKDKPGWHSASPITEGMKHEPE